MIYSVVFVHHIFSYTVNMYLHIECHGIHSYMHIYLPTKTELHEHVELPTLNTWFFAFKY